MRVAMQLPGFLCCALLGVQLAATVRADASDVQTTEYTGTQQSASAGPATARNDDTSTCKTLSTCLTIAEDGTQTNADRSLAYSSAGYIKIDGNELDLAEEYFSRALELDAKSDLAYAGRGDAEFAKGDYEKAIADAGKAAELKPDGHPEVYLILGTLADRNGDHEARIGYTNKAIALAPDFAEAYAGRGNGYLAESKYDLALADFNKAITLKPELSTMLQQTFEVTYVERGGLYVKDGDYSAAIDDYTRALQLNPSNTRALNDRGDAYNMAGDFGSAIADFTKAIESDPSYPYAYSNRGLSYFKIGRNDQALRDLNKAIELNNQSSSTYFVRGEVYRSKSDFRSALADFQKALELTPADDPGRTNMLAAIESVKR
ncbi:tetratricopeptide repeat protein [Rhizobium sp. IMFF44]|uniref:tetratricopeptide repeat protein n=1 Tax=Rhizobium sp. IMFF44 TaxID=3342350 RepID=UPI0035BA80C0